MCMFFVYGKLFVKMMSLRLCQKPLLLCTIVYICCYCCCLQVHLNKLECREKVHFSCKLFQKVKLSYFRFTACKVKHFRSFFVLILMIRAYKVKNQYLKILVYLHLSFNKWPSLQYKFWASLVLWNHNNGEDCWLGNDPEDEHWRPPQRG